MAQLSSDLEAFGEPMRSVDEAANHIAGTLVPVADVETVPLAQADTRVLAHDLVASMALPPFTNSAVDGYAVRFADIVTAADAPSAVADRVMAGGSAKGSVPPGRAVRIFTGAPMPDGSDTVFMQEDVRVDADGHVHFPTGCVAEPTCGPSGRTFPPEVSSCQGADVSGLRMSQFAPRSALPNLRSAGRCGLLFFRPATSLCRQGRRAGPRSCLTRTVSC
jgi:molybdopterin molybdotransferase